MVAGPGQQDLRRALRATSSSTASIQDRSRRRGSSSFRKSTIRCRSSSSGRFANCCDRSRAPRSSREKGPRPVCHRGRPLARCCARPGPRLRTRPLAGVRLKTISSRVHSKGASLVIEATDPVRYVATRPDPLTVTVDFRNVIGDGVANSVASNAKSPIAGVSVEAAGVAWRASLARTHHAVAAGRASRAQRSQHDRHRLRQADREAVRLAGGRRAERRCERRGARCHEGARNRAVACRRSDRRAWPRESSVRCHRRRARPR